MIGLPQRMGPARYVRDESVQNGVPSTMQAQANPARQHLLRAHLDASLPHVGNRQPVWLLLAHLSLELEAIARRAHL